MLSHVRLFVTHVLYSDSLGQNTGVGSLSLLQGIFPTQGLNPGLLHCRWILYQLSHGEAQHVHVCMLNHFSRVPLCARQTPLPGTLLARILEWVATPFSRGSSRPRDRTHVSCTSCIAGGVFTVEPPGKLNAHKGLSKTDIWEMAEIETVIIMNPKASGKSLCQAMCPRLGSGSRNSEK